MTTLVAAQGAAGLVPTHLPAHTGAPVSAGTRGGGCRTPESAWPIGRGDVGLAWCPVKDGCTQASLLPSLIQWPGADKKIHMAVVGKCGCKRHIMFN